MFRYDKTIQLNENFDMCSYLDMDLPIDLYYIQNKPVYYIKNYMYLNRSQMVDLVKYLRNKDLAEYNNQLIDLDYYRLVNIWAKNYVGVYTNKDGNCLFHAISLNLFGSESYTFQIRLAAVFMCLEYEAFIRKYMSDYAYAYDFDALILKTSKFEDTCFLFTLLPDGYIVCQS